VNNHPQGDSIGPTATDNLAVGFVANESGDGGDDVRIDDRALSEAEIEAIDNGPWAISRVSTTTVTMVAQDDAPVQAGIEVSSFA
jgi:hypothetical protein